MSLAATAPKQSNTSQNKKRVGAHQKQTKSFTKTYWPYLPLFVLAVAVLAVMGGIVLGPVGAFAGGIGGAIGVIAIAL